MKKILYLISFLFAVALVGCEEKEPATSAKVRTGQVINITDESALIEASVNVEISKYNSVNFGVMYSTYLEDINFRNGNEEFASYMNGKEYEVEITSLSPDTKYYYCAYLVLNGIQREFGQIKEFTTLPANEGSEDEGGSEEPEIPEEPETPESTFVFSVAADKTVTFSHGNLQYHPANDEWRFAPSQLDYIGDDNANISDTYNGWIDLFSWGTGDNPLNIYGEIEDYATFVDWGVNKIGSYAPNTWRTLTSDEWKYIINGRYNAEELIGVAQVNGVNGLILLPDGWTCPDGVSFNSGVAEDSESFADYQSFSASEWSKLEVNGAVFFPASGFYIGSEMMNLQQMCCYWASDAIDEEFSFTLVCESYWLNVEKGPKYLRQSVRLVKDN